MDLYPQHSYMYIAIIIVGLISEFLERHSKVKHTRASAYSRALLRNKGVVKG